MKISLKKMGIFVACSLWLSLSYAQDKRPIRLEEAIDLSIKNSKQLKLSGAQVEEATASLKEAVQKRLPDASASASYLRLTNANVKMISKGSGGGSGSGSGSSEAPKVNQALYGMINISLPIYSGGRIRYGIESSRLLEKATELDAASQREEVIQNTVEAYVNLYKAKAGLDLVNKNLEEARQRVKDYTNLEKNGLLARNDLLKAELQVSNTELTALDMENNWQLANINMNLMLGLPDKTVLVPDTTFADQPLVVKSLDDYVQASLNNRKDLESIDLRKQAADVGVKATKGEYLPSIALTGGYIGADVPNVLTVTNAANIGVGVSYSIGSLWKTKAKVQGAQARAKQLSASQEMLNDQVRLQVNQAYLNFLSSQKKIDVAAKSVEQANENYRIINNKYNNSLATPTDVLDADVARLQASMNYTFAKADAVVAYNHLLLAAGQLDEGKK